jgi:guanosine-3',5'-bis(diphosphate) 3'-pyrophosphohydrolase
MGREKHLYGIYRKMREKNLSFSQVLDIYGFRIIVKDRPTCYLALGALHALYQPVPGKFKDYIAIPKANGYQSLHTTLIGPFGTPAEIQIRDATMHHVAESGVASHWLYKDETALDHLQKKTHKWLQSLVELQSTTGDSSEFLEHVKVDLFPSEVYVFSPKGKIFALPRGATPIDLAYAVHTDIGDRCVACRINFETMPLRTELRNGDRVEIVTAPNASPNPAWLGYVKSARARSKIRHFLNTQQNAESAALGERLLTHALRDIGLALAKLPAQAWDRFKRASGARSQRAVLADIGLGKRLPAIVARRLAEGVDEGTAGLAPGNRSQQPAILIHGAEGVAVRLGSCCRPIPGDPIVGLIRKGHGLVVHTHDCLAIAKLRSERGNWVDVEWEPEIKGHVRSQHPRRCQERTRRTGKARLRNRGYRLQHRQCQHGRGHRRSHHPVLHPAGQRPHPPRADPARPAAHTRSDPHHPLRRLKTLKRKTHGTLRIRAHQIHARMDGKASRGIEGTAEGAARSGGTRRRVRWTRCRTAPRRRCRTRPITTTRTE